MALEGKLAQGHTGLSWEANENFLTPKILVSPLDILYLIPRDGYSVSEEVNKTS